MVWPLLIWVVPLLLVINAWRIYIGLAKAPTVLPQFVLIMTSLSAVLFSIVVWTYTSELTNLPSVSLIAAPNWFFCMGIGLLCLIRLNDRHYRASLPPSFILFLGWCALLIMH